MENYTAVIRSTPLRGEGEADANEAETDDHVPGANSGHWVTSRGHVENNDPDKSGEKCSNHHRSQPLWAFLWQGYRVKDIGRDDLLIFFAELGLGHRRG